MKSITIKVTDSVLAELTSLGEHMRNNPTLEEIVGKALEQGITQLSYRYERNAKMWIKAKEEKQELLALRAQLGKKVE